MAAKKKIVIGVTGILASGKTVVSSFLAGKGALRIDADALGHEILKKDKKVIKKILDEFGEKVFTGGEVDRKKLRKAVLSDEKKLKALNRITHPAIIRMIRRRVKAAKQKVVVIDAALLVEAGLHGAVDHVILVAAEKNKALKRAHSRGLSEKDAKRIIAAQLPQSKKRRCADFVIDNNGSIANTKEGAGKVWKKIMQGR